ncbi:uncharacterized protein LOC134856779 isoform X2 [Symsagittifera roscoffensis]|uniref:uncharacterized protein LOC134856779 isoform X2 n=1 Tax=Symsagittifera roscoffensis TaxID=84072 RepID=UPI00307B6098
MEQYDEFAVGVSIMSYALDGGEGRRRSSHTSLDDVMGWIEARKGALQSARTEVGGFEYGAVDEERAAAAGDSVSDGTSGRGSDHYEEDNRPRLRRRLFEQVQHGSNQENSAFSICEFDATLGQSHRERNSHTTKRDHRFIRLMTTLLVHQKDYVNLRRCVKWATILTAVMSVFLYARIELSLYRNSSESSDDAVMCLLRLCSSVMITAPNITFRKELKKMMEREHSRLILLSVNPKKYIKVCACFLLFEIVFAGGCSYYWAESYWPEVEAANSTTVKSSGKYALMVVHPLNIIVTNMWNFAIAIMCMMVCGHLIDALSKLADDLRDDKVLCELNFATTEKGRRFALQKYPLLAEETKHFTQEDIMRLRHQIMTPEKILTRYYDLQKWFLVNIVAIFFSVIEFLFSLLGDVGREQDVSSLFLVSSPLFWVPFLIRSVMMVNLKATMIVPHMYPLEERLPVFQRFGNLPLSFHVYGQKLNRTSVAALISVLLIGLVGRIWSLADL